MEYEILRTAHQPSTGERVLSSVGPVLWIAMSYVDPGIWAASVEGGARIGFDLALLVFTVIFSAILCQYLSALVAIATGRNLSQICRQEYDDVTCLLLGIQAEISIIVLDLTMVLGTAYGLHVVFGIDLFNCVFLTGFDAVLFPFFSSLFENPKAKTISICLACFLLSTYVSGALISKPESSISVNGILNKLTGENVYVLMSILGANIMPHNFYLHSSTVQQDQRQTNVAKGILCRDLFFATFCIFSGICLVNCMLMNSAANLFYSRGLSSLTLQDALSLLDQGFTSSIASVPLIFIIFFSNQLVAVTWSLEREVITQEFFELEIPGWLHRATIRIIAIIPALSCVWNSGAEGIFQFLIFAQVLVALLLPPSVIPLFRVASSRSIMGAYKVSRVVEFLAFAIFVGILGLNIFFVVELVFGSSDWVTSLKWNIRSNVPISYIILLVVAFASLRFMVWLVTTPLKSARCRVDLQALMQGRRYAVINSSSIDRYQTENNKGRLVITAYKQEPQSSPKKSFGTEQSSSTSPDPNFPETLLDKSEIIFSAPTVGNCEAYATFPENFLPELRKVDKRESRDQITLTTESRHLVEKTRKVEGGMGIKDGEAESWELEESIKDVSESCRFLTPDCPESFNSLSGKGDEFGSGGGNLSRLAGLSHAARCRLTAILEEFWGQLFDFHGQVTQEAKAKELDVFLGIDIKVDPKFSSASITVKSSSKESSGYFASANGSGPDLLKTPTFHHGSMQHIIGQSYTGQLLGSSMKSNYMSQLDLYVQTSAVDSSEKRYHSVRVSSSSVARDQQPATIHGYNNVSSRLIRVAKEKASRYHEGQLESLAQVSKGLINSYYIDTYSQGQKPQNELRGPLSFHHIPVAQNCLLRYERSFCDPGTPKPVRYSKNQHNVKKFYSLPNVSGLCTPLRNSLHNCSAQWDNSISRPVVKKMCLNGSSLVGTASGFNGHFHSKVRQDAVAMHFSSNSSAGSLWSSRPYEHFGVANKTPKKQEDASNMNMETKLLKSFRRCTMKLLNLEGSDWLFRQNDGADEDLIGRVASREHFLYKVETLIAERNYGASMKNDNIDYLKFTSVPNCGDGCVWRADIVTSFGVWCIHRILALTLVESQLELLGNYTYVLNRLQGILDLAFSKPRSPLSPCFCLQLPTGLQQKSNWPVLNNSLVGPPSEKEGQGKLTSAAMVVDMIKDVEIAMSCHKGSGEAAFSKGREILASVLKRYKRHLLNKPGQEEVHGSCEGAAAAAAAAAAGGNE